MSASVPTSSQASPGVPYQRHAEAADDAERAPVYAIAQGVPLKALAVPECQQAETAGRRADSGRPRSCAYNDTSEGRERNGEARRDIELVPPSRAKGANRSLAKPANLAEVLDRLGRVETLTLRQHHDTRSALKCVARVVGRPLHDISTDIGALRAVFADAAPANGRVSVGRWTRVRSVCLAALRAVGVPVMPGRMPNGLKDRTRQHFGTAINPQIFRQISATTTATENPGGATDIMLTHSHTTMATSEKYYNKAKMLDASRRHQMRVGALRQGVNRRRSGTLTETNLTI